MAQTAVADAVFNLITANDNQLLARVSLALSMGVDPIIRFRRTAPAALTGLRRR